MNHLTKKSIAFYPRLISLAKMSGEPGSGAGRGGGGGGSIKDAGGAFGKLEVAREEEYFYKKQREQLSKLQDDKITQEEFHKKQIREHEEALNRHKDTLSKLQNK